MRKILTSKWTKAVVFLICLVPFAGLVWRSVHSNLGANPVETLQHTTGDWTLRFLVFTLAITPLRKQLNRPWLHLRFELRIAADHERGQFGIFQAPQGRASELWWTA